MERLAERRRLLDGRQQEGRAVRQPVRQRARDDRRSHAADRFRRRLRVRDTVLRRRRPARFSGKYDNDKGTARISAVAGAPLIELDGRPLRAPPDGFAASVERVEAWKQKVFLQYMYSCVDLFKRIRPTWKAVSDHNAYVFQCRAGGPPASVYLCTPTRRHGRRLL